MKKKLVIILSIICIIAGGYFTMEYLKQKEKEERFWKVQEARIEKYIHYNIQDVKSITFIEHKISPMGVPHIKGYINDNRELWFDAGLDDNDTFERKLGRSGELGKLIKDPEKSVSEIEKEEKEKKQE
ncbi:hypothetical protein BK721_01905 [Bacillus thuringiensis serovar nigeriensis]|jgi:hypothetical protein|uniref:DUF1433 domain-containing protein n=1 Tax=Bacillus cereus group TaxID=86661 RepID=UPI0001A06EDC|nr:MULTISPECIES: DUF1433 domain-containing protein [Bacillus cereus group]MRC99686.1 DUF1433 domain-containing protein [Bacillus thuringiensis]EEL25243.1 hypothetical protein bcere0018_57190 [Bacillus cereus Rock1-15]MCU5743634.1 DUF1433 domain-containing protein [Bacillus cereus]MCU9577702.1 DUF1433 domain-containing protein [Bacillus cereus]MDA1785030.1 DUF1433 domain-containing protein [Bacillus cereus]